MKFKAIAILIAIHSVQKNDTILRMYIFVIYTPNFIIFCRY